MEPVSVLMFVFGIALFLAGVYLFTGHKSELLLWKSTDKNPSKETLRYIGKIVMATSLSPVLCGILAALLGEASVIPYIIFVITLIGFPIVFAVVFNKERK